MTFQLFICVIFLMLLAAPSVGTFAALIFAIICDLFLQELGVSLSLVAELSIFVVLLAIPITVWLSTTVLSKLAFEHRHIKNITPLLLSITICTLLATPVLSHVFELIATISSSLSSAATIATFIELISVLVINATLIIIVLSSVVIVFELSATWLLTLFRVPNNLMLTLELKVLRPYLYLFVASLSTALISAMLSRQLGAQHLLTTIFM